MYLPELRRVYSKIKEMIVDFRGINYSERRIDGSFEDCEGISLKDYPTVTLGRADKREGEFEKIIAMYKRDGIVMVDGDRLYYNGKDIGQVSTREKSFCSINTKIVIFPEKKYINTNEEALYEMEYIFEGDAKFGTGEITLDNNEHEFAVGDAVEIRGSLNEDNNKSAIIREITETGLKFDNDIFFPTEEAKEGEPEKKESITIERRVPDLEYICESNNRVWGVLENTIYASKLGDPTNFNVYDGLSTDAYTVAVASPGEFTAAVSYANKVIFFKEDCIHIIYGTKPSNYQLYTYNVPGVMKGAEKSVQIIDEVLYYKGKQGIYAYTGGVPSLISSALGSEELTGGVSGTDGRLYYICVNRKGEDILYSYDTHSGFWLKEKEVSITDMAYHEGNLLYVSDKKLYTYSEDNNAGREWEFTLNPFTEYIDEKKIYSKLYMRYELQEGSYIRVYVSHDGHPFEEVDLSHRKERRAATIPIFPQRCDSFKIKVCGKGDFKIRTLSREYKRGSERQ